MFCGYTFLADQIWQGDFQFGLRTHSSGIGCHLGSDVMNFPKRFMLAFPFRGNTWQHYKVFWVDLARKTIEVTRSSAGNGTVYDESGLMFHFYHQSGMVKGLTIRIAGKIERHVHCYDDQDWIVNGLSHPTRFYSTSSVDQKEEYRSYPIRFEPVSIDYSTRQVDSRELSNEKMYDDLYYSLDAMLKDHCVEKRVIYMRNNSYRIKCGAHFKSAINVLQNAFLKMSHSQVVHIARRPWQTQTKPKSLRDLFVIGYRHERDEIKQLLDKAFPRKEKFTAADKRSLVVRCVNRFIRRHPTQATTNLLKMLAMNFKNKNLNKAA